MAPGQAQRPRAAGFAGEVRHGLQRTVAGAGRCWLVAATLLIGVLVAVLITIAVPVPSIAAVAGPVQLLMSVLVPLTGVLLAHEAGRDADDDRPPASIIVAAVIYAVAVALTGFVVCVIMVVITPGTDLGAPHSVWAVALGAVAVQITAQLVGTGLGFWLRRPLVAFLSTIVWPLGLWLMLGVLGPLAALQQWLTPFGAGPALLTGTTSLTDVAAWAVVLVLWGGTLNLIGVRRQGARRAARSPDSRR